MLYIQIFHEVMQSVKYELLCLNLFFWVVIYFVVLYVNFNKYILKIIVFGIYTFSITKLLKKKLTNHNYACLNDGCMLK